MFCKRLNAEATKRFRITAGFTLIELLVVIAIIALLLSIVIPSLREVKRQGHSAVCLANLKSLATAWVLYADENDGNLVGGSTYNKDPEFRMDWVYIQPALVAWILFEDMPITYQQRELTLKEGALWPYLENIEPYKCPGDRKGFLRSYSVSNPMNGDSGWDNVPYMVTKMTEISLPSSKLAFAEYDDPRIFRLGPWVCMIETEEFVDMVSLWHHDRSNFAFADGHAEFHKWIDTRTIDAALVGEFYLPSPDNPDLEWIQRHYKPK